MSGSFAQKQLSDERETLNHVLFNSDMNVIRTPKHMSLQLRNVNYSEMNISVHDFTDHEHKFTSDNTAYHATSSMMFFFLTLCPA